jgi:sugar O-acyltransferase (sialic acid O-acetyltransferase NeuD family)
MHKNPVEMQNVVIIGASGHGSVVLDCIEKEGKYNVVGFVDSFKKKGKQLNGYKVLGNEFDLPILVEEYNLSGGIIAIGDNWTRSLLVDRIEKILPEFPYISVVHPSAIVGKEVQIGSGTVIMPGVIINTNTMIGNHCILNTSSSIDHDGFMNSFSSLAPNVCAGGNFTLGKCSAICLGTNIIENITIGSHTVVGAGALVLENIKDYLLVYGSPAKVVRKRIASETYLGGVKDAAAVIPLRAKES